MKIERKNGTVIAEFDGKRVKYDLELHGDEENYLTSEGVIRLEEWKIDLIEEHGVDLDEIRG